MLWHRQCALWSFFVQHLEELSIASSQLENEVKSLRRVTYDDSARQQQQRLHSDLPTKVCSMCSKLISAQRTINIVLIALLCQQTLSKYIFSCRLNSPILMSLQYMEVDKLFLSCGLATVKLQSSSWFWVVQTVQVSTLTTRGRWDDWVPY